MKITTTTTIEVSEENLALIPMIIAKNGGALEGETNEEAIIRIRNFSAYWDAMGNIKPHIEPYFGEANKAQAEQILAQLEQAITTNTVIDA